ncbi:MAG: hypothetical protein U0821_05890 [Chloroflexota bacterium]
MAVDTLRVICAACGNRLWIDPGQDLSCEECGGELRQMGPFERFVDRWFAPPDMRASDLHRRHLQLVELLWTEDGRGREWYEIVRPHKVSYTAFVRRVNVLVCRALDEGWMEAQIPRAPIPNDAAYGLVVHDPDRFVSEMERLFQPH